MGSHISPTVPSIGVYCPPMAPFWACLDFGGHQLVGLQATVRASRPNLCGAFFCYMYLYVAYLY